MIVSDLTHRVSEFRVYSADGKYMLAQATIKKYRDVRPAGSSARGQEFTDSSPETCRVPENIVLEWKREQLSLDVALKDVKVNQFAAARRAALVRRADAGGLRQGRIWPRLARQRESEGTTAIRESLPVPEPRNRVRLRPPSRSGATTPRRNLDEPRPTAAPKGAVLLPVLQIDDVVGAPYPTAAGTRPSGRRARSRLDWRRIRRRRVRSG